MHFTIAAAYRLNVPGDQLTPGEYLLSVTTTAGKETAKRAVGFTVR